MIWSGGCRSVWAYDALSKVDHDGLDGLTAGQAYWFAAENGYDLGDYTNREVVSDWWGFTWTILAERRGLLTPRTARLGLEET
jgi:hypothetical protein